MWRGGGKGKKRQYKGKIEPLPGYMKMEYHIMENFVPVQAEIEENRDSKQENLYEAGEFFSVLCDLKQQLRPLG